MAMMFSIEGQMIIEEALFLFFFLSVAFGGYES